MNSRPEHAVILAGGISSRMGEDKALLPVAGIPMLHRIAQTALQLRPTLQITIVGRGRPHNWPAQFNAQFLLDDAPERRASARSAGPLLGLITALTHLRASILLLPCDTPLISSMLLERLCAAYASGEPPGLGTMARLGDTVQPTLAIYTPALLPTLQQMLIENRRALHPLAAQPGITAFQIPAEHQAELLNVNTPEDFAQAERALKSHP
jgi:molybdopterin-guanine dinucleotide biosynthesis protein A